MRLWGSWVNAQMIGFGLPIEFMSDPMGKRFMFLEGGCDLLVNQRSRVLDSLGI